MNWDSGPTIEGQTLSRGWETTSVCFPEQFFILAEQTLKVQKSINPLAPILIKTYLTFYLNLFFITISLDNNLTRSIPKGKIFKGRVASKINLCHDNFQMPMLRQVNVRRFLFGVAQMQIVWEGWSGKHASANTGKTPL